MSAIRKGNKVEIISGPLTGWTGQVHKTFGAEGVVLVKLGGKSPLGNYFRRDNLRKLA